MNWHMGHEEWAWFWAFMVLYTPVWIVVLYVLVSSTWEWLQHSRIAQRVPAWKWLHHSTFGIINLIGHPLNRPLVWLYEHTSKCVGCGKRCDGRCGLW